MSIATKSDLRLFRGSLDSLKLKPIEINIEPEREQQKQHIQVLTKAKKTELKTEILF